MPLTLKQIEFIFDRCVDLKDFPEEIIIQRIQSEFCKIDWERVSEDDFSADYSEYYNDNHSGVIL